MEHARSNPFLHVSKLSYTVPEPEDLLICGSLESYDKVYDRTTPKNERRLERFKNKNFFEVTTTDDPVIRRLANEDTATVFASRDRFYYLHSHVRAKVGLLMGYRNPMRW